MVVKSEHKIVHVIFSLATGGVENMLVDILNFQSMYFRTTLFIINDVVNSDLLQRLNKDIAVVRIGRKPGTFSPFSFVSLNLKLFLEQPSIIHCHNHNAINFLAPTLRAKAVLTLHDTGYPIKNLRKFKSVFAISKAVKNDIESRSEVEATVVYNGIHVEKIQVKRNVKSRSDFRIVQVSRLIHEKKGQHLLIEALKIVKGYINCEIFVDFIGEGPSLDFLKKLTEELGLNQNVRFLGLLSRNLIYKSLCDYDLLVQPSLYEGFGLTIAEALAANIQVVVSDLEGPKEVLAILNEGITFIPDDVSDLADKIMKAIALKDHPLESREKVLRNFNIEFTAKSYLTHYNLK